MKSCTYFSFSHSDLSFTGLTSFSTLDFSAYFDEERVIHKKRPVVAPGEMEQIKLTKEQLMKYPGLKTITVKIEEA